MEDKEGRVFLHFLNSQIVRKVEDGKYGPFSVIALPKSSKYADYTFIVDSNRIHADKFSDKKSFTVMSADRDIRLTKSFPDGTDESGRTLYRDESITVKPAELQSELDAWKVHSSLERKESLQERFEEKAEEDMFMDSLSEDGDIPIEL